MRKSRAGGGFAVILRSMGYGRHSYETGVCDSAGLKTRTRARVLARRDAIGEEERARRSAALCARIAEKLSGNLAPDARVAGFAAFGSELDLSMFLRIAYDRGCRVCLPCMVREASAQSGQPARARMTFFEVSRAVFDAGEAPFLSKPARAVNVGDPWLAGMVPVRADELDVVAIPLVAFDAHRNRLGYGGGNYDGFLDGLRPDAEAFGVAFAEQEVEAVPVEPHDLPLARIEVA